MTTLTVNNGRTRKTLAEQIDRLDGILDGLAEALNAAVAQAVKEAVAATVKATLAETLARPDLRHRLVAASATQTEARPSVLQRLSAATRRTLNRVAAAIGRFGRWVAGAVRRLPATVRRLAAASWRQSKTGLRRLATVTRRLPVLTWRLRGPVLLALSVGGVVGWGCYVAGPLIASTVGGLAGAAETLLARARQLQRRPIIVTSGARE